MRNALQNIVFKLILIMKYIKGTRGSVVVKALCCKPEGRVFETRIGDF
jgi:hypothetical protein